MLRYITKTFAMMLGEYNYIDNFSSGINDPFSIDGYFIMLCFFLIMPLALMNFLVGILHINEEEIIFVLNYLRFNKS
jgi:hypothetical protein